MLPMLASFWTQAILLPGLSEALGLQAQATTWHPNALDPGNHLFQVPVPPRAWARKDLRTLQSWEESGGGARGVFGVEELLFPCSRLPKEPSGRLGHRAVWPSAQSRYVVTAGKCRPP